MGYFKNKNLIMVFIAVFFAFSFVYISMVNDYWDFISIYFMILMCVPYFVISYFSFPIFIKVVKNLSLFAGFFYVIYYAFGLLPMSSYRDYISIGNWSYIIFLGLAFYFIGVFFAGGNKSNYSENTFSAERVNTVSSFNFSFLFILVSFVCCMIVVSKHGFLFLDPEARFDVSAKLAYLIEFSMPALIVLHCYNISKKHLLIITIIVFFLLISLGYRNQPVLLTLAIVLINISRMNVEEMYRYRLKFASTATFLIFFMGVSYITRINNSVGRTLNWSDTILQLDIVFPAITLPYIPIHMASREGLGVAEIALERIDDVVAYVDRVYFFFLDFMTLLPGYSLTSGRVLGYVVNLNETSSLTPSIVGGLSIAFGQVGVYVFLFVIGYLGKWLHIRYLVSKDPKYLAFSITLVIYFVEIVNRGIFKPMYICALVIVFICTRSFNFRRHF